MAITLICGFEMQALGEAATVVDTGAQFTTSNSVVRSGAASLKMAQTGNAATLTFQVRPTGGTLVAFSQSFRFYFRYDAGNNMRLVTTPAGSSTASGTILTVLASGGFQIADGANGGISSSANLLTINDGVWHRIEVDANGSTRTLYVDGVQWAQSTGRTTAVPQSSFVLGNSSATSGGVTYFDDLVVDDGSIGAPSGDYKTALLIPTAGNNAGGWTDGAGGTGDIHGSVDNIPPVGVSTSTAAAKIKNATSTTTGDYVATMQTYLAAGIPAGSTINAVQAIGSHGEEITTGNPKPGATWIASNPAQTAGTGTFDYGDNVVEGTYPTGWPTHYGPVSVAPSVTLGTAPTVTVRKNLASTRVTGCCFMGLYVNYTPPNNPVGVVIQNNQAVNRASFF